MPLFAIQFPDYVVEVLKEIIQIAIFDIPYVDSETIFGGWLIDLSEDDEIEITDETGESSEELKSTFETIGYDSRYIDRTMGSVYVIIVGII